jgi:hypothetical protein
MILYLFTATERAAGGTFTQPDHLPACEAADLITCSIVFVQVGGGHSGAPAEDFDTFGYLRCLFSEQLLECLFKQTVN